MIYFEIFAVVLAVSLVVWIIHDILDHLNKWNSNRLEKNRLNEIERFKNRKRFVDV